MQLLLLATVLFAAAWFLVLRPKPADGGGAAPEPTPAAQEAPAAAAQEAPAAPGKPEAAAAKDAPASRGSAGGAAARRATAGASGPVRAALRQRKALALAFVDPRTADARAVRNELASVSRFGGRAVALSIPIASLSRYAFITREVEVTVAPTVVIIAPDRTATTIVGFTDRAEIEQGLADALSRR